MTAPRHAVRGPDNRDAEPCNRHGRVQAITLQDKESCQYSNPTKLHYHQSFNKAPSI